MSHMNAASPRQSLVKGERLTRYELAAVILHFPGARRQMHLRHLKEAGARRSAANPIGRIQGRQKFNLKLGWPPRVRKRPLSEIALWITGSPASWRVSQTPECNGLLTATRGIFMIVPQRQPGKFRARGDFVP